MRTFLLSLSVLAAFSMQAQDKFDHDRNWVPNGDFETVEGKKLKRAGGILYATGWGSPTKRAADLFSESAPVESNVSSPKNLGGEQTALSGSNYAGLRWWSYQNKEPRSYLQTKLTKQMKKDSLYCVRYYVSLGDLSKYATAELGAYIGKQKIEKDDESNLTFDVKVPNLRTKIYDDMFSWQGVCGVYQADGFEQYLVIGNFAANEKTPNAKTKRPRGESRPQVFSAYYYVDNVELYPIKDRGQCTCEQLDKAESEFIFSRKGAINPNLKPAEKVDQQVFYFKRFQRSFDTSMENWLNDMVGSLKEDATVKVKLIGHMDATEVERTRVRPDLLTLSKERAEAVKDALVEAGIDAARITVEAKSGDEPVDTSGTDIGMSKNRRVEVEVMK
ncbi:MAG: OmpA family protein [Flavobacteriales bacterium]|jgi:outer membrane protein OmpA-like peptidoglycan-associated protein|nr:OmpA family protein [Flavobacteriales bacterium]